MKSQKGSWVRLFVLLFILAIIFLLSLPLADFIARAGNAGQPVNHQNSPELLGASSYFDDDLKAGTTTIIQLSGFYQEGGE